ncbi:hypothetical protein RQP46_009553 [Phenoliferia psychrophenolica]
MGEYPILRAVAIHTLHTSVLSVTGSNITSPTNNSFGLTLEGQVHKVGVFPARLSFKNPVDQETFFNIDDVAGFARFSEYLITQEAFTWRLKSEEVTAEAFGFIPAHGLTFVKAGSNDHVSISDFQLPGDDPAGGISLAVTTQLTNPSAFGIEIGTLIVDLYYKDLYLGPAQTAHPINLTSGVNHINLVGRLLPYADDPAALEQLSEVFSNYLNGLPTATQARGRSVTLPNGEVITWLQIGIQALVLNVPLQSPTGRISPINSITIEALSLSFDPSAPYAPLSNSSQVSASFGLPFGFSLNIVELANQFSIIDNRTAVASLSAPLGMSQTTILTQNAGYTTGGITLDLPLSPLTIGPNYTEHLAFDQFTYDLTTTNGSKFILNGNTTAVTDTPLGQVKLSNIGFTVPAGLIGLESLATYPTTILSVDVVGGTPDAIILAIDVGLTNPSNLDLMVGNVTFQLFNGKSFLGTATLPANANPGALKVLTDFTSGTDTPLTISGFNGSTAVESLTQAFMALHLNATLKGLGTKLLNYANLTVLPTTGVNNDLASSIVSLQNPFSSDLRITEIQSNITHSSGLFVGSIVTPTDFLAKGHTANISPVLAFNLNLYPPDIFTLLRVLAVEAGLPTDQIDGIVALGGYTYVNITGARSLVRRNELEMGADSIHLALGDDYCVGEALSKRELQKRNIYSGFDLPSFVLTAFAALKVDVALVSVLHIGDFTTNLAYSQAEVPAYTDSTLTLLLPILARPIVQRIVDQAILSVTTVIITDPEEDSFVTQLVGAITNAGPFDAVITFTTGLTVAWNGAPLGQIAMPNVTLVEDVGAQLNIAAAFAVADVAHLTEFTGYLLTEPSFVWQIYGEELEVTALGITVAGISISKDNGVVIDSFDLPANDPAGGVALTLATTLVNPSSVGISLSGIAFSNTFGNTVIGPAAATGAFILAPKATIALPLAGRLIPQTTPQGLQGVSTIFNGFIHGLPSDLIVHGVSAGPADVTWLNTGIQKLAIAVILPAMKLDVINSITINQLTLMFTEEEAYSPAFSTNDTVALFQLPFAFPVNIVQAATSITTKNSDAASVSRLAKRDTGDFATLNVPLLPSATDVQSRSLLLQFTNIPFKSIDNGIFSSFLLETTVGATKGLALHGSADTVTSTAIGDLSLVGIAFSVETAVQGLQGLNAQPTTVSDLDVFHGYSSYLQINANAHLFNPSEQLTIGTGDVAFGLMFQGQLIGTADITGLVLVPGVNVVPTMVHYSPSGSSQQASGQILLQNFIQGIVSDTLIVGNSGTTPIASLKAALSAVQLATTIPPLEQNLVTQASLSFPLDIGTTGVAEAQITLGNPFTAVINIDSVITIPVFSYVLGLSSTTSSVTSSVNQEPETCDPTGTTATVQALILAAVKNLKTNLTIESVVRLDSYKTPLDFVQNEIVDVAELSFSGGLVNNVTDHGFTVALQGSLLNAGHIALPPICSAGGQGVPVLETTGILTIADLGKFTNFATSILLGPSFTWTITTSKLRVFALGTIFDNVTLTKNVTFSAFNGLPGVTIRNPDFPGDAPNGIQLVTDSSIPSPSNLGIELGHASFIASFEGQEVGPIDAFGLVLAPLAVTDAHLTGTIIKRTSAASTTSLGVLFSEFLAGANQTLDVTGNEVVTPAQPNSPCVWLSAAFKKLTLHVILPGHVYEIISSVKLQDLTVTITSQSEAYSVPSQNNETDVKYNSVDTAVLTLPVANAVSAQTSTGQDANLVLDFKKPQILQSLDTAVFNQFFNDITNTAGVSFNLHGSANVTAGTNAGSIPITADASLFNPSNLTIVTTDVVFGLQFMSQVVGAVDIGDLLLVPGVNNLGTQVHYAPTGGASTAAGELLLANYVQGVDSQVQIVGTPQTTPFGSLQEALGTIQIQTSIPAIHQLLITEADLSFPLDVGTTGLALASFHLSNPFTASINLLGVVANATYQSFFLGQINQPTLNPPVSAGGHKNITSRTLPFTLTTDPKFLISFLEAAATAQGVDLGILLPEFAYVLGLASTTSTVTTSVNTKKETCAPTGTSSEVAALILAAVKNLRTDLGITSTLKLDDFQTDLAFVQNGVPTVLDDSVLYLTGLIGKTIVDEATLAFTGGGPFDALIEFVTGVDVYFMGTEIANIVLPPICSPGGISLIFYSIQALLGPSPPQTFAFDKLAPGVTVSDPDFPGDASNGIELTLNSLIPSPSNLGIELGDVSFIASYQGSIIGPVDAKALTLPAKSITAAPLTGVITYRDDPAGVSALGAVFSQFLTGQNTTLLVTGASVTSPAQPRSPVAWLSAAFQQFSFDVSLHGKQYEIISSILLKDLTVSITSPEEAFAALVTNNETDVVYRNPFKFSLQAIQAGGDFIINYANVDSALLTLPKEDSVSAQTSTGNDADLVIHIVTPAVLSSIDNGGYENFFSAITNDASVAFMLHGGANGGIPFSVSSSFPGIQGFNGKAIIPARSNTIPSEFHYMPADAGDAVAQSLLTAYLETKGNIPLVVSGDLKSSPYVSLQPALSHISLQSGFPGQGLPLVHDIVIYLDLITVLCTNEVAFTFSINNHLETSITIKEVSGSASQNKMTYATFNNYVFKNTFQTTAGQAPGGESEKVEPTLLPMTAAGSLALFSPSAMAQGLDIDITASVLIDQYNAPSLQYSQTGVPYTIITTAGSTTLDLATLGANPVGTLTGLLGALGSLTECIAGGTALSILPALLSDVTAVLGDLSKLPPFLR